MGFPGTDCCCFRCHVDAGWPALRALALCCAVLLTATRPAVWCCISSVWSMNARPRNVNGLREELLAKEKELSNVHEFLLDQDNDLRSCLHRVGDLELNLLANRPDSCATNTDCDETPPPPREITPPRHELISGDARAGTAVEAQGNASCAGNSNHSATSSSGYTAFSRRIPTNGMCLPSAPPPDAGAPVSSPPLPLPGDDDPSRARMFAERSACCRSAMVTGDRPEAPVTPPPRRNPVCEHRRRRAGDGNTDPADVRHRLANAAETAEELTPSAVAPEPRRAPAAPAAPPSRPAAAAAAATASSPFPSSDERRSRVSPSRMSTRTMERGSNGGEGGAEGERGGGGRAMPAASTAGVVFSSPRIGSHRLADRPLHEQGRREPGGDAKSCFATMRRLAESDERVAHAERRAGAAEVAERSAAASAVTARGEARVAKEEAERLRLEGLELSCWRQAVVDLRDALRIVERNGEEGRGDDRGDRGDCDPVARHATWVSSPALGTLLPHLQQCARELLSDLVDARARIPAPSAVATAASSSSGNTRIPAGDRGCACVPTVAERRSTDEGQRRGEARSRTHSFELQSRREGQQQCAVFAGVSHSTECSRGARCGGGVGETGGAAAAAVGLGVAPEVVDKSTASLEKDCETLRIVVQALREKEEDSQRRIATLEERMLQASLAAVERDALVSVLRRQLALRDDSYASDAADGGSGGRGRTKSCPRGRAGYRGAINAASTPEPDVARSGGRSRLFADDVDVEPSPSPSTRLPQSGWNAASEMGDGPDPSRSRRLPSSMLCSAVQPEPSQGRRQAYSHARLDAGCCRQAESCSYGRSVHNDADSSRHDSNRHPCNGNRERGQTAVAGLSPFRQAPSTPNATPASTETPPMVALRGGYRDRRGGSGGSGGGSGGTGCSAENASGEIITPRPAKEEKRPGDPLAPTPTTDVIRRLLYENTPTPQMEPGGSAVRIAATGRRLFSEDASTTAFPRGSGNADGVRGGTTAATRLFDSPCRRGGGRGGGGPSERSGSRGGEARGRRNSDGRATAVLAADAQSEGVVARCSVGTVTTMERGRIAKGEIVLRERLLQARRDFSALRTGVPADELLP